MAFQLESGRAAGSGIGSKGFTEIVSGSAVTADDQNNNLADLASPAMYRELPGVMVGGAATAAGLTVTIPSGLIFFARQVWTATSSTSIAVPDNAVSFVWGCADGTLRLSTSAATRPIGWGVRDAALITKATAASGAVTIDETPNVGRRWTRYANPVTHTVTNVDAHASQHASGGGDPLPANAISEAMLGTGVVTTVKIGDDAVDATKLKDDASIDANRAVTTNHLRDSAVTEGKIAANAVTATKIPDNAITDVKIGTRVINDTIGPTAGSAAYPTTLFSQLAERIKAITGQANWYSNPGTTLAAIVTALSGKAASGANSDITSLAGLTTALSVAQGGTSGTTQATARTGLGLGNIAPLNSSYGALYEDNESPGTGITVTTAGTYYGWVSATAGELAGTGLVTADTARTSPDGDALVIGANGGGKYEVSGLGSFRGSNSSTVKVAVFVNGVIQARVKCIREFSNPARTAAFVAEGILSLVSGDVVDMRFTSSTNGDIVTVFESKLKLIRIGP